MENIKEYIKTALKIVLVSDMKLNLTSKDFDNICNEMFAGRKLDFRYQNNEVLIYTPLIFSEVENVILEYVCVRDWLAYNRKAIQHYLFENGIDNTFDDKRSDFANFLVVPTKTYFSEVEKRMKQASEKYTFLVKMRLNSNVEKVKKEMNYLYQYHTKNFYGFSYLKKTLCKNEKLKSEKYFNYNTKEFFVSEVQNIFGITLNDFSFLPHLKFGFNNERNKIFSTQGKELLKKEIEQFNQTYSK